MQREILECEEGVNVVVIDDELCLEYDFEERRPLVSVHPFFTKVMKAHQVSSPFLFQLVSTTLKLRVTPHCLTQTQTTRSRKLLNLESCLYYFYI